MELGLKHTSMKQKEVLSDILNCKTPKKQKFGLVEDALVHFDLTNKDWNLSWLSIYL